MISVIPKFNKIIGRVPTTNTPTPSFQYTTSLHNIDINVSVLYSYCSYIFIIRKFKKTNKHWYYWCACKDLNLKPPDPKSGALSN